MYKVSSPITHPLQPPLALRRPAIIWPAWVRTFPWWLAAILLLAGFVTFSVATQPSFQQAFRFISAGLTMTALISICSFALSLVLGLLTGIGRLSKNVAAQNAATFYVEVVRGVPMLVLIFFIAFVGVSGFVSVLNAAGDVTGLTWLSGLNSKDIPMEGRAVAALSITYGAFLAEVFRAGIQSIPRGQMEAARALGLSYTQAMRYVILPQAIRNVLPALGNDFISMLKDSSLVSVLAIRDLTQTARLFAGQTFQFNEAYTTLAVMYLLLTLVLSLLVKWLEKRMQHT